MRGCGRRWGKGLGIFEIEEQESGNKSVARRCRSWPLFPCLGCLFVLESKKRGEGRGCPSVFVLRFFLFCFIDFSLFLVFLNVLISIRSRALCSLC
jgi:hypothetical protein